jgi:hypothetical protein
MDDENIAAPSQDSTALLENMSLYDDLIRGPDWQNELEKGPVFGVR